MQQVVVKNEINKDVTVEIEGVGIVRQITIADKMFQLGLITWETRMKSQRVALSVELLSNAINNYNLYPKQF